MRVSKTRKPRLSNGPHVRHALHPTGGSGLQTSVLEEVPHVRRAYLTFGSLRKLQGADLESERDLCRRVMGLVSLAFAVEQISTCSVYGFQFMRL